MFAFEEQGYKKEEVDAYIAKLKAELVEKKLNLLNSEQKVLDLTKKQNEIDNKERNILKAVKALEEANRIQEEGSRNLSSLKNRQSLIFIDKVNEFIEFLDKNHPELRLEADYSDYIESLVDMITKSKQSGNISVSSENDSMRLLLSKMEHYRRQKDEIKTVKVERKNMKHIFEDSNGVDEFLSSKPEENQIYKNIEIEANGFDLKEAVNPKDDLDEIMKAFDFFNNDN